MPAEPERRVDEDAAALRPESGDDLTEEDGDVTRAFSFHGGPSDEMACEFVVVLIRDRGGLERLEMAGAVDEAEVVGLAEDERVARRGRRSRAGATGRGGGPARPSAPSGRTC